MAYRKVSYMEQCFYVIMFWIREKMRNIKARFYMHSS